jgi:hypothetical protein
VHDLEEGAGTFTAQLNAAYVDNATDYHVIYGDVGTGTDGVVAVASALAVPLSGPETATVFVATHVDLHVRAAALGVAARINDLLLLP